MAKTQLILTSLIVLFAVGASACGGDDDSNPTAPSGGGGGGGGTGTVGATITITSTGVSPSTVTVSAGSRVTFVNNNSQTHEMFSDPHPIHTDCPPMNDVGVLSPGQTKQTGVFTVARSCSYHDHGRPDNTSLRAGS